MALLIDGKGVLEDRLQRDERHRGLRTRGRRLSVGGFLQYHANYPRCKRLVQRPLCRAGPGAPQGNSHVLCCASRVLSQKRHIFSLTTIADKKRAISAYIIWW